MRTRSFASSIDATLLAPAALDDTKAVSVSARIDSEDAFSVRVDECSAGGRRSAGRARSRVRGGRRDVSEPRRARRRPEANLLEGPQRPGEVRLVSIRTTSPRMIGCKMISVRSSGASFELARDAETILQGDSIGDLIAAAKELDENNPLCLPSGACLEVELTGRDRATLFEALEPAEGTDATGGPRRRWDEALEELSWQDLDPLDDGIIVNGRPWGWFCISERFCLVPIGPRHDVLWLYAWMAESMTGAVITATLACWDDLAALAWYEDDDELKWMAAFYNVENGGLAEACHTFLEAFSSYWRPICPLAGCPNAPDWYSNEWTIALKASERLDERTVASAVAVLCEPCREHMSRYAPDGEVVLSLGDRDWKWDHGGWAGVQ